MPSLNIIAHFGTSPSIRPPIKANDLRSLRITSIEPVVHRRATAGLEVTLSLDTGRLEGFRIEFHLASLFALCMFVFLFIGGNGYLVLSSADCLDQMRGD